MVASRKVLPAGGVLSEKGVLITHSVLLERAYVLAPVLGALGVKPIRHSRVWCHVTHNTQALIHGG